SHALLVSPLSLTPPYPLPLHDALPIWFATALGRLLERVDAALGHPDPLDLVDVGAGGGELLESLTGAVPPALARRLRPVAVEVRSEEHTSELQSREKLVCRLLLENKKT